MHAHSVLVEHGGEEGGCQRTPQQREDIKDNPLFSRGRPALKILYEPGDLSAYCGVVALLVRLVCLPFCRVPPLALVGVWGWVCNVRPRLSLWAGLAVGRVGSGVDCLVGDRWVYPALYGLCVESLCLGVESVPGRVDAVLVVLVAVVVP